MYTRNTSLAEKAWKVRREVFMLLFTKQKTKNKKKLLLKDWLVISRNQHVEFLFPPVNLELTDCSLNHALFCMQLRMGVLPGGGSACL